MARKLPKLCHHKQSNRAYVTDPFTGDEHYLGIWGAQEAQAAYDAWIAALIARRQEVSSGAPPGSTVSVAGLILDYLEHAQRYYRKGGKETSEIAVIKSALLIVNELAGTKDANAFSPTDLKAARQAMIEAGWTRESINKQVQRVRRCWRWGVEQELVRPDVLEALRAVQGLSRGRTAAVESEAVEAVETELVLATLPRLSPCVARMVEIQWYSGMRPGELVIMRPCDLDRSSLPWLYVPESHKTEHHGKKRRIWLGPKARALLTPLLKQIVREEGWLFPSRARGKHAARRTHWTVSGYRIAIQKACKRARPPLPPWHPQQLRHRALTDARQAGGLEAAQAMGGHDQLETTQIYAERNEALGREIAERLG